MRVGAGVAVALVLAIAWFEPDEAAPLAAMRVTEAAPPAPFATARAPENRMATEDASRLLLLPDGSRVEALNGATHAPPLARGWDPTVPYTPIVGRRWSGGIEWYVHADGTQSTTRMVFRPDLGRMDAVTSVAHLGDGAPPPVARQRPSR